MHDADADGCAKEPLQSTQAGKRVNARRSAAPASGAARVPATTQQGDPALSVQEQERRRIAGDLHDGLGPLLTLIRLELAQAAELVSAGKHAPCEVGAVIERAAGHVSRAFDELRRTVINLRPAMLDDLGIVPTLGWLIREFELSRAGVLIHVDVTVREGDVPQDLKIVIFRICQEALNNIVRHAQARCALLSLVRSDTALELCIEDDGRGMPGAAELSSRAGGGLAGMCWRAAGSGGKCEIGSEPGRGTRIRVTWPLPRRHAAQTR